MCWLTVPAATPRPMFSSGVSLARAPFSARPMLQVVESTEDPAGWRDEEVGRKSFGAEH